VGDFRRDYEQFDLEHRFITDVWRRFNQRLENALLPIPPYGFLRDATIRYTMFVDARGRWLREQLRFLERSMSRAALRSVLREDDVGRPPIASVRYLTSHNTIHHAYHFARFLELCETDLAQIRSVIEWGGGYGNQAAIFRRMNPGSTYVIIDSPLLAAFQSLYLKSVFGPDDVHLVTGPTAGVEEGVINVLPVTLVEDLAGSLQAQLFVSTWALSESSVEAQDFVVDQGWFGADHLLLAYQQGYEDQGLTLPFTERVGVLARKRGAVIEDFPFLTGNSYAFL
jgi:hypothetical protein